MRRPDPGTEIMTPLGQRVRRVLGLGPSRAELIAEAETWRRRSDRSSADARAAYARAKASEKAARAARVETQAAQERLRQVIAGEFAEPARAEGCRKVRFHREAEAAGWIPEVAGSTGEDPGVYHAYGCNLCPRSPVTHRKYFHVGHRRGRAAQAEKAAGLQRLSGQRHLAARDGALLSQRVSPETIARLRRMTQGRPAQDGEAS